MLGVAAVVAFLALVASAAWFASRNPAVDNTASSSSRPVRIAVLPFVNLTGNASVDYLADGLTDEVIAQLNRSTPDDIRGAISQFEAAVQRHPHFAGAWAKLAEARHVLVMMAALAPASAYPAARQAAERALAADSKLADAHLAQGLVQLWYDWKPADAAKSFEKALALNESHAAAHHDYAWSLMALGRTPEAIAHITAARDLDPLSVRANNDIGWLHLQTAATGRCRARVRADIGNQRQLARGASVPRTRARSAWPV